MMRVNSLNNPRIKRLVRLRDHQERLQANLTVVDGWREVEQALAANVEFQELYVCWELLEKKTTIVPKLQRLEQAGIAVVTVSPQVFAKIAYGDRQEGILGLCRPKVLELQDLLKTMRSSGDSLLVVAEKVEKPGNLGAILRTCDAAGVDGIVLCDSRTDVFNPNVIRASLGCVFHQRVAHAPAAETHKALRRQKITICATVPQAKIRYDQVNGRQPLAVVVGSEDLGLSAFWREHADMTVHIPMLGKGDSLNVASSAAIVIYEILRQRGFPNGGSHGR